MPNQLTHNANALKTDINY